MNKKISNGIIRVPTGIDGMDRIIEGGLERNTVVSLRGGSGTGKTIFSLKYLYIGAKKYGEPGIYISFAESKQSIYNHGAVFGWNFEELEKQGKFYFIRYTPHEVATVIHEGGGTIRDIIESMGAKRLVIDSLTAYSLLFESKYKQNESILDLFEMLKSWECTVLVTTEKPLERPGGGDDEELGFLTDGIINLYHSLVGSTRERALEVIKMRNTQHSNKLCMFTITKKDGIVVFPSKTVKLR